MFNFVLDIRTLVFLAISIGVIYSIGIFFFGRSQREFYGFDFIALGVGISVLGFLLLVSRYYMPDFWTMIVSNFLLALGLIVYYHGIRFFCLEDKRFDPATGVIFFLGTIAFFFFFYVRPSINARIIIVQAGHFLINFLAIRVLMKDVNVSWRTPRVVTAGVFALDGLYALYLILWIFVERPSSQFLGPDNLMGLLFLSAILLITGVAFGLVWMVSMRYKEKLMDLAMHDPLTEILNRRGVEIMLEQEIGKVERKRMMMCAMILDIDHFKDVNDSYGHSAGDRVLAVFAKEVQKFLRKYDIFGRIGGEEFIILLPDTTLEQAEKIGERLREHIEKNVIDLGFLGVNITISIGVSNHFPEDATLDSLIPFADRALFQAKQEGRNRVAVFDQKDVIELM